MNFIRRLFSRKPKTDTLLTPETDLEMLNRKQCPDCGTSDKWTGCAEKDTRHIECLDCGSAYNVLPCEPPYLFVHHIGFNREGRRIRSERG